MDNTDAKTRLIAIRDNLPMDYSQNSARKLMSAFENYRQVAQALGNNYSTLLSGVQSEYSDIEFEIRTAIKGTPKKEAESRFGEAKRHLKDDISVILANLLLKQPGGPT